MPPTFAASRAEILRRTSRSFALSIRLLPARLRPAVETAYLLARIGDTLADAEFRDDPPRAEHLAAWRAAVASSQPAAPDIVALAARRQGDDAVARAESELLRAADGLLAALGNLPGDDRRDVCAVVDRLLATMQAELSTFAAGPTARPDAAALTALPDAAALTALPRAAAPTALPDAAGPTALPDAAVLTALPDAAALTDYTEGIAGCVGAFWTRLVARHALPFAPSQERAMTIAGRRYGRGLQLVNVLRDLPRDLRRGRCFLPQAELTTLGLAPRDLLQPGVLPGLAPVLTRWQRRARFGLLTGLAYAARLPRTAWRVRVATALPAAIGLATLDRLERSTTRLDPAQKVRVPRSELLVILIKTAVRCAWQRRH